jgi:hypothetical protein
VELSGGAFVIETTTSGDRSLLKVEIFLSIARNFRSLSRGRMQPALKTELDEPVC